VVNIVERRGNKENQDPGSRSFSERVIYTSPLHGSPASLRLSPRGSGGRVNLKVTLTPRRRAGPVTLPGRDDE